MLAWPMAIDYPSLRLDLLLERSRPGRSANSRRDLGDEPRSRVGGLVGSAELTVGLAALAGLASFLSPCVLALVPAYVGYLGGRAVTSTGEAFESRWTTFAHGLAFVLGFSLVFITLGVAASALGSALYDARSWLARLRSAVVTCFWPHYPGLIPPPFL